MKVVHVLAIGMLSLLAVTSQSVAGDSHQQHHNHGNHQHGSSKQSWSGGHGQSQQFRNLSDVVRSFKKKYHHQPSHEHPSHEPPKGPVVPFPPIVTDPISTPPPVVRDHRDPRPWGKPPVGHIDTSGAPGGVVVTGTPIIRDHRDQTGPIIRDHRKPTGPVIRDHRK
jgi:hypothetical protein